MTERERGAKATAQLRDLGIDCVIDSARAETITVLCGSGVMAYHDCLLLSLGEQVTLTEKAVEIFVVDGGRHNKASVFV